MRQIEDGRIICNKNELINIIKVIDLLDKITIQEIESIINNDIILYEATYDLFRELSDKELILQRAPTPFYIRREESKDPQRKEVECLRFFKCSLDNTISCTEEVPHYKNSSKYFFLVDDVNDYIKNHKDISNKSIIDRPITVQLRKKERDSYLKVIASLFARIREKPWKDSFDRDAVSLIVRATEDAGLDVCVRTVRKIVNEIKEL